MYQVPFTFIFPSVKMKHNLSAMLQQAQAAGQGPAADGTGRLCQGPEEPDGCGKTVSVRDPGAGVASA